MIPEVSIVIVNYNTFELTSKCIESIYLNTTDVNYEIILVDNCSSECDPNKFIRKYPAITLVINDENGGFAKGNNIGIKQASGKFILLLNSDTKLINNAISICLNKISNDQEIGVITCQLINPGNKIQKNCRRFRTISWELLEIFPIFWVFPKNKREELMLHHYFDHQREIECDWVSGAFLMFPRRLLKKFPNDKLHEDFFMYCEDILWCWFIKKKLNKRIIFTPIGKVFHEHHGSEISERKKMKIWGNLIKNNLLLFEKTENKSTKKFILKSLFYFKQKTFYFLSYIKTSFMRKFT